MFKPLNPSTPTVFYDAAMLVLAEHAAQRKALNANRPSDYGSKYKGIDVTAAFKLEGLASAADYCGADKDAKLIKEAAFSLRNCLFLPMPFYVEGCY